MIFLLIMFRILTMSHSSEEGPCPPPLLHSPEVKFLFCSLAFRNAANLDLFRVADIMMWNLLIKHLEYYRLSCSPSAAKIIHSFLKHVLLHWITLPTQSTGLVHSALAPSAKNDLHGCRHSTAGWDWNSKYV